MKRLPNILSAVRLILSVALFFLSGCKVVWFVLFIVCGITDILDGIIARVWNAVTPLGARLDSIADTVFFCAVAISLFIQIPAKGIVYGFACVIIAVRLVNLFIGRLKFDRWGGIHTAGNKWAGVLFFVCAFFCMLTQEYIAIFTEIILAVTLLAALEEMMILLTAKEYEENRRSFFR